MSSGIDGAVREQALQWLLGPDQLTGIISLPPEPARAGTLGVLIVVGGPQYRIGSHRQFTLLARALARAGVPTLRFDVRGMGDSAGDARSFDALDDDIASAIQALRRSQPQLEGVVLWGLCDAASACLLYLQRRRDAKIAGLCLLNPWVRSAQSQARTRVKHYYLQRLRDRAFWAKLLSGKVAAGALLELASALRLSRSSGSTSAPGPASFQDRMLAALQAFEGPTLLILSGEDYTAKEFLEYAAQRPAWQAQLARPELSRVDVPGADHTFSNDASHLLAEQALLTWLGTLRPEGQAQPAQHPLSAMEGT
jgi:exosortase A-associated hydrolase 1